MCSSGMPTGQEGNERASEATGPVGPEGRGVDRRLARHQRIGRSSVFREAFAQGSKWVGRFLVMWLRRGEGAGLRLGVVASRRSFRKAVARARAKRLLREAYRLNRFRFTGEVDVVLVARSDILDAGRRDVENDLLAAAGKAGILKGPSGNDDR